MSENYGFGKPKYGGNKGGYKPLLKLKDGDTVVRIMPPFKSLREQGIWAVFHKMHFGYAGVNRRDPAKQSARPFACIEEKNRRTKMIEQECPECENIADTIQKLEDRKAELKAQGKTPAEIDALPQIMALKSKVKGPKAHNLDKKWYMNVKTPEGSFEVLAIPHRAKQALDVAIADMQKAENGSIDPLDPDHGVWFRFHREGKDLNTTYTVYVVDELQVVNGMRVKVTKEAPLSQDDLRRAFEECRDLSEVGATVLTEAQIQRLVNGSGDPEEVDFVFDEAVGSTERSASRRNAPAAKPTPPPVSVSGGDNEEPDEPVSSSKPAAAPVDPAKARMEAILKKRAEEEAAAKAAAVAAAAAEAQANKFAGVDPMTLSDDEFMRLMGDTSKL